MLILLTLTVLLSWSHVKLTQWQVSICKDIFNYKVMPQSAVLVTESCQQAAILPKVNPQLHKHYVDGFMSDVIHSLTYTVFL